MTGGLDADARLVEAAVGGNQRAFRTLYEKYEPLVTRRLRRVLGRMDEVEDVLQQTFVEVHRSLVRFDRTRPLAPWLSRIAMRQAIAYLRAKQRRRWLSFSPSTRESVPADVSSAEDRAESRQLVRHLFEGMDRLPPKKRVAFALYYLEGLGFTEIGAIVDASPQTVRARVLSAKAIVTKHVERITREPMTALSVQEEKA